MQQPIKSINTPESTYSDVINLYGSYLKLESELRKGWLMCEVPAERKESVSDHTLQCILLSNVLIRKLNLSLDIQKVTEMLMIHDLGEVIIGDISEVEANKDLKKAREKEAVENLLSTLEPTLGAYYLSLWKEMSEVQTEEAVFANLIDKIDAVLKAGIYEEQYNLEGLFLEFSNTQKSRGTFNGKPLEDLFEYLCKIYGKEGVNKLSCTPHD